MDLRDIREGTILRCDYCGIYHEIVMVRVHRGGIGIEMACGHRNALCEKCKTLVIDATPDSDTVTPECFACAPEPQAVPAQRSVPVRNAAVEMAA